MGADEVLKIFMEYEIRAILDEAHGGVFGGRYLGKSTAQKILRAGLWWPMLHNNAYVHFRACDVCHRIGNPSRKGEIPLHP